MSDDAIVRGLRELPTATISDALDRLGIVGQCLGIAPLDAAFRPARSDYLYYIAKPDGHSVFAKTLSEHNANVERYLK